MKRRTFKQKGKGDLNQVAQTVGGSAFEIPTLRRADRSAIKRAELATAADRWAYNPDTNYNSNIGSVSTRGSIGRRYSSGNIKSLLEDAQRKGREAANAKITAQEELRRQKELVEEAEEVLNRYPNSSVGLTLGGYKRRNQKKKRTQKKYRKVRN